MVGYGTFSFDSKKYTYARAIMHIEEILAMLVNAYKPKFVAIEDIQLRANAQSFKKLAQLQGVLVNFCEKNKLSYGLIAPTRWQNFCRARGRNSKEVKSGVLSVSASDKKESKVLSLQFVRDNFGVETENDNLADAICISYYTLCTLDNETE